MCEVYHLSHRDIADLTVALSKARRQLELWEELEKAYGCEITDAELHRLYVRVWEFRQLLTQTLRRLTAIRTAFMAAGVEVTGSEAFDQA